MLYNDTGSLILDESVDPPFSLVNGGWYFIACLIEPDNKTAQYVVGDRGSGTVWASEVLSFTGELNRSCTADLILGMHADSYWYAGGLDDWFLDCDTQLTAEDLENYFLSSSAPTAAIPPGMWTASRSRGRSRSGLQAVFILRKVF